MCSTNWPRKPDDEPTGYETFWATFGAVLKEGLYEDYENRERLLGLARFRSTAGDGWTSLAAYVERMKPGQDAIFTISGEAAAALAASPQLEGFRAKGVEVLLLTDPIDEFWMPAVRSFQDKPFKSAAGADADLGRITADETAATTEPEAPPAELDRLIAVLKSVLKESVKDVRVSQRLTDSPVCLIAGGGDMDMYLERMLRQSRRLGAEGPTPRILEINGRHPLIRHMAAAAAGPDAETALADLAHLLLDQAYIVEGDRVQDPLAFARRLSHVMERGLA